MPQFGYSESLEDAQESAREDEREVLGDSITVMEEDRKSVV